MGTLWLLMPCLCFSAWVYASRGRLSHVAWLYMLVAVECGCLFQLAGAFFEYRVVGAAPEHTPSLGVSVSSDAALSPHRMTSDQVWLPAEFKHITRQRKRK